jgi:hypothetical protein
MEARGHPKWVVHWGQALDALEGPGRRANETGTMTVSTPAIAPTHCHPGEGGRPVGNSSGSNVENTISGGKTRCPLRR